VPGFRLTRITRDGATVVGQGQTIELKVRRPGDPGAGMNPQFGRQQPNAGYDEDMDMEEEDE
jgi:hypothetical protein